MKVPLSLYFYEQLREPLGIHAGLFVGVAMNTVCETVVTGPTERFGAAGKHVLEQASKQARVRPGQAGITTITETRKLISKQAKKRRNELKLIRYEG